MARMERWGAGCWPDSRPPGRQQRRPARRRKTVGQLGPRSLSPEQLEGNSKKHSKRFDRNYADFRFKSIYFLEKLFHIKLYIMAVRIWLNYVGMKQMVDKIKFSLCNIYHILVYIYKYYCRDCDTKNTEKCATKKNICSWCNHLIGGFRSTYWHLIGWLW